MSLITTLFQPRAEPIFNGFHSCKDVEAVDVLMALLGIKSRYTLIPPFGG